MLDVAIAGAGVTGLVTAFAFARYGHSVDVYERKMEDIFANEGGAGIQLQPNAMRILDTWGIDISDIAHVSGGVVMRRYSTGEPLGLVAPVAGYQMYVLRSDFRRAMLAKALATGARVHFGRDIAGVDASLPALLLKDGTAIRADMVIGADGIRSKVRQSLFPSIEIEVQPECTFQLQLPFSDLKSDAARRIISDPLASVILSPGTGIVVSPVPSRNVLDVQFLIIDYGWDKDMDPERWYAFVPDMTHLRRRYKDFGGIIPEALSLGKGAWKWRFVECVAPTWVSQNGRVILAGDAVHAMVPYSGQGAGMCVEDAAVLAELFRLASPVDDRRIEELARTYQQLRKPRTDRCHRHAKYIGVSWGLPDGRLQQKRDAALRQAMDKKLKLPLEGNSEAHPLSHEFDNWLEQYDAIKEVRQPESLLECR
ncbi:hypothetical protein A1O7_07064 [Cladophialophora yegresii CBS 114405]|uniref:FAD-binding domain-containing protein n=1 Tax=Cladophialophora yegresii CBS 114405 TaxID=1182544 RepID=W9VUK6_9EURO|nr:uncharacterized protein A1O7_07064 [Cladophialophora yegresii CBS 114405]EXJ56720.1 hypothetical protein A1O7_07064 [Cladophialophora yegresii CBS 114405]